MSLKKIFLPIFFSLISTYVILNIFRSSISFDWTFQDWLINYEGGFVRRGLSGEIILRTSSFFDVQIQFTYFCILSILSLLFYLLFFDFLRKEKLNFQNLFIILSPLSISFIIYNFGAIGRKEILLFIIFLIFIFLLSSIKKRELSIFFLIIFFPLVLLLHEGLIFFISAFLVIFLFEINKTNKKFIFLTIFIFILISLSTFILMIIFKGNTAQVEVICSSLSDYPIEGCFLGSAISMLSSVHTLDNVFNNLWVRVFEDKYLYYYPIFAIIAFYPLIKNSFQYCFNISVGNKIYKLNFSTIAIIYFVNSLPLYIFAHDWGRWLHINYILLMITFFYLKRVNKIYPKNSERIVYMLPELFLSIAMMFILMLGVFIKKSFKLVTLLTILSLIFVIALALNQSDEIIKIFNESYIIDKLLIFMKVFTLLFCLFVFLSYKNYINNFELITGNYDYLKKFLVSLVLIFYSAVLCVQYSGVPTTFWVQDYTMMYDNLGWTFKTIKTIPHLF